MKPALVSLFGLALVVSGCATTHTLSVSAASAVRPAEQGTGPVLRSRMEGGVALQVLSPRIGEDMDILPGLFVEVANEGGTPLAFSLADVRVFSGSAPVRLYTEAELTARIDRDFEVEKAAKVKGRWWWQKAKPDPEAAAAAAATRERRLIGLRELLGAITVPPGRSAGGVVRLHAGDIRSGQPLRVVVTFGGTDHEFILDVDGRRGFSRFLKRLRL